MTVRLQKPKVAIFFSVFWWRSGVGVRLDGASAQ